MSTPVYTSEQLYQVKCAITDAANSPEAADKIVDDANALIETTRNIRDLFESTLSALAVIDSATAPDGKPLNDTGNKFTPQWRGYSDTFDKLIASSTEQATTLGVSCDAFETTILPALLDKLDPSIPPLTLPQKVAALNAFITVMTNGATGAGTMNAQFTSLSNNLASFAGVFNAFVTRRLSLLEKTVTHYNKLINKAQDDIKSINTKLDIIYSSLAITAVGGLVIGAIFPGFGWIIAGAALAVVGIELGVMAKYLSDRKNDENDIKTYQNEIAKLQQQEAAIQTCQKATGLGSNQIPLICEGLGHFEDVWQDIMSHCTKIAAELKIAGAMGLQNVEICKLFLEKGKTYLGPLGVALAKYGELQPAANSAKFVVEKRVPTDHHLWGNTHPYLKMRVEALFKSHNLPITSV